jgi:hypothetical protein
MTSGLERLTMAQTHDPSKPPPDIWDQDVADRLVGKLVLVGVTRVSNDQQVLGQDQFHGVVVAADRRTGIKLELEGTRTGDEYNLPPQTSVFSRAQRGEYRLRATGEIVVDPDYLATWTITVRDDA